MTTTYYLTSYTRYASAETNAEAFTRLLVGCRTLGACNITLGAYRYREAGSACVEPTIALCMARANDQAVCALAIDAGQESVLRVDEQGATLQLTTGQNVDLSDGAAFDTLEAALNHNGGRGATLDPTTGKWVAYV